jgi:hypothetical protein
MVQWIMADELEMIWKKEIITTFKVFPSIYYLAPSTRYISTEQLENYSKMKTLANVGKNSR